jgi:acetyl esterase/lipase
MYGQVLEMVAQDLADAGYYTLVASYRLAPCGVIMQQPCHDVDALSGRPPEQTDDVKAEIRAIRADTVHCNGMVGVVGGSAGGSHALFVALDTSTSSTWNSSLRPDCAVGLSGAYDFSDRTPEDYDVHHADPVATFA